MGVCALVLVQGVPVLVGVGVVVAAARAGALSIFGGVGVVEGGADDRHEERNISVEEHGGICIVRIPGDLGRARRDGQSL